jgi:hypothetical protein
MFGGQLGVQHRSPVLPAVTTKCTACTWTEQHALLENTMHVSNIMPSAFISSTVEVHTAVSERYDV